VRGIANVRAFPVKTGETFKAGDFVLLTTSGVTAVVAAGSNFGAATTNATRILGQAQNDAVDANTNALNTHVDVILAQPGTAFCVPLYHGTPASAVPSLTQIGTDYEMRQVTAGFPSVDVGTTTNKIARIVDFDPNDYTTWPDTTTAGTTQYANVWIEIIGSASLCTGAR